MELRKYKNAAAENTKLDCGKYKMWLQKKKTGLWKIQNGPAENINDMLFVVSRHIFNIAW